MKVSRDQQLLDWFEHFAKPFLEVHAPTKLASIESEKIRLERLVRRVDEVTVCFLGNSGVGKSTLLNALAAGGNQILPAGGIGPLTALATEVSFTEKPCFKVTYHPKNKLWQMVFALEARLIRNRNMANKEARTSPEGLDDLNTEVDERTGDIIAELSEEQKQEALFHAESDIAEEKEEGNFDTLDGYIKQAKNIVCENQFIDKPLEYLVDSLRYACGLSTKWSQFPEGNDLKRVQRVSEIMKSSKEARLYERHSVSDYDPEFMDDLKVHAAGFLSPLIERIEVGWPSDVLRAGVKLVDLPGVGIAQDSYRDVTKSYVREKARAVIVVVDRAGPTESTVELLRTSGYWDRLVGAADDPLSDPCAMLIAVTKVDDVMQTEWQNQKATLAPGQPSPKKREVFQKLVQEFKPRMRAQITEQLGTIGVSDNEAVQAARQQARVNILESLEIHPVSAPELRRLLLDDEEDRSFLDDAAQTGIPQLQASLKNLAVSEKKTREIQTYEVIERLYRTIAAELEMIQASWQEDTRAADEADRLKSALDDVLHPKQEEFRVRAAAFREYLQETVPAKIDLLVMEAREVAEAEVNTYLIRLRGAHWATLRAAVRRGGTFFGRTNINLPDDISGFFQEPMAAVWGQKLLRDIRRKTSDLADDIEQMVTEICDWANQQTGSNINTKLLENQQKRIADLVAQMKAVGKEAVDEMRATVKNELSATIRGPIQKACDRFVKTGNDIGPGVKLRIIFLFQDLAKEATTAAKGPAGHILKERAGLVMDEVRQEFEMGGDPLQDTADLIVQRNEERMRRSDAQKRRAVLAQVNEVLTARPSNIFVSDSPT